MNMLSEVNKRSASWHSPVGVSPPSPGGGIEAEVSGGEQSPTSDALGAAAAQIGSDAQALIAWLKNKLGLSYGDITALLKNAGGIELTRGAAAHVVRRAGERAESTYVMFKARIPRRYTVYPDETGWRSADDCTGCGTLSPISSPSM